MIFLVLTLIVGVVIFYALFRSRCQQNFSLIGKHVMITGGSSGIGLALAVEAASKGASVSIIARNEERLQLAKKKILSYTKVENQRVCSYSVDLSQNSEELRDIVQRAENELGPIYMLMNCAGIACCYRFEETPVSELEKMLNINFYGSVFITRAVVPLMKKRQEGKIIFFSSIAGLFGLYGYSAYSSSKFAIIGLAEALHMELKPFDISVTVSCPPDTDTPGLAEELKTKLPETKLISEAGGLVDASVVAKKVLIDAMNSRFMSVCGFESWAISTVCSGMMPASNLDIMWQVFTMGILRLFLSLYLRHFDKIIKKCKIEQSKITSKHKT